MYAKKAYSSNYLNVIKNFFDKVSQFVCQHNVISKAYQTHSYFRTTFTQKRTKTNRILQKKFRNSIKIVDHFTFIERLNKDAIIYVNDFDIKVVIREELAKRIKK